MKISIIFFRLTIVLLMISSCKNSCRDIDGIAISEIVLISSNEQNIDYCKLVEMSLVKDLSSIRQLSMLEYHNAVGYDHGSVLVDIIDRIGEDIYILSINNISEQEKRKITSYIIAGLEYGNNQNVGGKRLNEAFPEIYQYVHSK